MKVTAVICEYNPFHKGHELQINNIKQSENAVVCIMSGGFVQRGLPAIYNKYDRARAAIKAGADLVVELPYPYSCSGAEFFCQGGVSVAHSLGIVDELCFGSECGDVGLLEKISDRLMSERFSVAMRNARSDKQNSQKPYAVLRSEVYYSLYQEELTSTPNDTLGIEYISALKKLKSDIVPITYKREKGYSATESRRLIKEESSFEMIPDYAKEIFDGTNRYDISNAERAILAYYRFIDSKTLSKYDGMTNGIAERLIKSALMSANYNELVENVKGKSYTNAKINRCIINGMVGAQTKDLKESPRYTQVLASNDVGRALIKRIQKFGNIELLTKPAHYKKLSENALRQAELSNKSEALLSLMADNALSADFYLKQTPYIEKNKNINNI